MKKAYKTDVKNQFKVFDNMLEGVSVYKLIFNDNGEVVDGILEYENPATVETMGLDPTDVIGRNAIDVFGLDFIQPHIIAINRLHSTGEKKHFEVIMPLQINIFLFQVLICMITFLQCLE